MNYKTIPIALGIILCGYNSFGASSYDDVKGYDWISKDEYKKYIDNWGDILKSDSSLTSRIDPSLSDAKFKDALKDPNNWTDNIGNNYFSLNNHHGYTDVYQFKGPEANSDSGDDHWVFFALPKSVGDNQFRDIYVYSDNDKNLCHFEQEGSQGAYNYICPEKGNLCYIAVVTKHTGDPTSHLWACRNKGEFDAASVYLSVKTSYLTAYKEKNNCDTTEQQTFSRDGHNHIIHPTEYRCSDNLCWSPSWKPDMGIEHGNLNCWDADEWYEIRDGNICKKIRDRDRSMCAEVYTSDEDIFGAFTCKNVIDGFQKSRGDWGGQCVPYVRKETGIEYNCCNGDAKNCYEQARTCGYETGSTPTRNAIAVFDSWKGNRYGHVGIVIDVDIKNSRIKLRHSNWRLNELVSEEWVSTKNLPLKGYIYSQGESCGGPGTSTPPTDPPASGKLPDFITSKVTMGSKDGKHEKYTWKINETAYVHDYIDNIGTADWEGKAKKIKVPFYLSKGTKEDSHSEWVRVSRQEIKKEHLKVKDKPKHEYIKFNLAEWANDSTVLPGRTYNFVVCADRPKDENNGDGDVKEKHKSNNCSTEAVFYVDFGPARNVDLMADNLALTGGRTELQAGEKYGLQVEVSNIGTEQPWNGFRTKYEIKGPGTGDVWQKIGDEHSKASSLYAGAIHFESMTGDDEVSAPTVGGDYVFRACADYEQVVPETDESNNCSAELPVTVIAPPPPAACVILNPLASLPATGSFDLAATSIEFPDTVQQGDEMHPKAQVCGVSGTSPKTRAAWAYANCDGTGFTAFDGDTDDGLSAGECVTEENKEGDDLANMPPGRYVMYFIANGETQIPESDHSNNVQAKEFVVE